MNRFMYGKKPPSYMFRDRPSDRQGARDPRLQSPSVDRSNSVRRTSMAPGGGQFQFGAKQKGHHISSLHSSLKDGGTSPKSGLFLFEPQPGTAKNGGREYSGNKKKGRVKEAAVVTNIKIARGFHERKTHSQEKVRSSSIIGATVSTSSQADNQRTTDMLAKHRPARKRQPSATNDHSHSRNASRPTTSKERKPAIRVRKLKMKMKSMAQPEITATSTTKARMKVKLSQSR